MLKLISVLVEGYRSIITPVEFDFDGPGLYTINGSNGSGKTTLLDAIYWGFFGESLKTQDVETKLEYRSKSYQGTRVLIKFEVNEKVYRIARHSGYKSDTFGYKGGDKLMLFFEGELVSELRDKKEIQKEILSLIGFSKKSFLNSILFGQRLTKLLESSKDDRSKVFEEFFELDWINDAKEKATILKNEKNSDLSNTNFSLDSLVLKLDAKTSLMSEQVDLAKKVDFDIKELKSQISKPKKLGTFDYTELKKVEQELSEIKLLNNTIETNNRHYRNSQNALASTITKLKNQPVSKCPKCSALLDDTTDRIKEAEKEIKILEEKIEKTKGYSEIEKKLYYIQREEEKYEEDLESNKAIESNNQLIESKIKFLKEQKTVDLKALQKEIDAINLEILHVNRKKEELSLEISKLSWWSSTGFGANGLKMYIISDLLKYLNICIKNYSYLVGLEIEISLNLDKSIKVFETKIFKKDGVEIFYNELSGGEKTRIDLMVSFGLFDLKHRLQGGCNVMFFDEAFENLDEEGVYSMFELLREKAKTNAVYMITHNKYSDIYGLNQILVTKESNNSIYEKTY